MDEWANICAAIIVAAYEGCWASSVGSLYRKGEPCYDLLVNDWFDDMPRMVEGVLRQWPEAIVWCEDALDESMRGDDV